MITETIWITKSEEMLASYKARNLKAWEWAAALAMKHETPEGMWVDPQDFGIAATENSMSDVKHACDMYTQDTLDMFEGSIEAYYQDLIKAYSQR